MTEKVPTANTARPSRKSESDLKSARALAPFSMPLSRGACACGGGCPNCTPSSPMRRADFSRVRLHPSALDVTAPLQARAVTRGQDIYFHPGEFQPHTARGQALIAHELAHTLQTRHMNDSGRAAAVSHPGDALERNADALARGETAQVLAAPAGVALRSGFDNETADQRARRERLLQSISTAVNTLLQLLRTGGLLQNLEVAVTRGGVQGVVLPANTVGTARETFINYTDRDTRLRRIIRTLLAMGTQYRSAPIPATFTAPTQTAPGQYDASPVSHTDAQGVTNTWNATGADPDWLDLLSAYQRYLVAQGLVSATYELDWYYLDEGSTVNPGAARGAPRMGGGIQTGVNVVVPDIDREPLRYWMLTGTSPTPRGSTIVELWHDTLGYYYMHRGQRVSVPSPWQR